MDYEVLKEILMNYFDINGDTYAYNLTRVKSAFEVGTITLDDFEEFTEETIDDMVAYIKENMPNESKTKEISMLETKQKLADILLEKKRLVLYYLADETNTVFVATNKLTGNEVKEIIELEGFSLVDEPRKGVFATKRTKEDGFWVNIPGYNLNLKKEES